jgi:flagellar hook-length control protein FliK
MLAKSVSGGSAPAQAAGAATSDKPDDAATSAATDPDPSAAALALILQSMAAAQAPSPAAQANPPAPAAQEGTNATNAIDAAGSSQGKDGSTGASLQNLLSLLGEDADSDLEPAPKPGLTDNSDPMAVQAAPTDNSAALNASAASAQMSAASHFQLQHSAAAPDNEVKSPVGSAAWADELGGKVTWMAHQGIQSASLQLSPEHLGPVEVHISVQDGGTSVWFGASQADTRAALEQALPRLREMFATQGMSLADAGVSRQAPQQQPKQAPVSGVTALTATAAADSPVGSAALLHIRLGLLDTYA